MTDPKTAAKKVSFPVFLFLFVFPNNKFCLRLFFRRGWYPQGEDQLLASVTADNYHFLYWGGMYWKSLLICLLSPLHKHQGGCRTISKIILKEISKRKKGEKKMSLFSESWLSWHDLIFPTKLWYIILLVCVAFLKFVLFIHLRRWIGQLLHSAFLVRVSSNLTEKRR